MKCLSMLSPTYHSCCCVLPWVLLVLGPWSPCLLLLLCHGLLCGSDPLDGALPSWSRLPNSCRCLLGPGPAVVPSCAGLHRHWRAVHDCEEVGGGWSGDHQVGCWVGNLRSWASACACSCCSCCSCPDRGPVNPGWLHGEKRRLKNTSNSRRRTASATSTTGEIMFTWRGSTLTLVLVLILLKGAQ